MKKKLTSRVKILHTVRARPFLKWAGGKSRLSKQITDFFPKNFDRYFEPFLGGGAIYFAISPREGVLNDLNKYLIGTYEIIRDNPYGLINKLKSISEIYHSLSSIEMKSDYYYKARAQYNSIHSVNLDKAALFIFLNKAGYNGMYRENSKGEYNIPFGKHEKCLICDEANLLRVANDLKDIKFTSTDYKDALKAAKRGDLIYLDPPYFPLSKTAKFTEYQAGGFSVREQEVLKGIYDDLHSKGCYVMMSNSYCDEIRDMYADYNLNVIEVGRTINSKKGERGKIKEYVVTNY